MKRIDRLEAPITIELDGEPISARPGETVAAAVIASGEALFSRSVKYHRPRGAYCLSSGCSHCLMRVDGIPNVTTCQTRVRPGMRLERQNAFPDAKFDLWAAADVLFPTWFNHHEFLAGVPLAEAVLLKVTRHLSGLGELPDRPAIAGHEALTEEIDVAVVGAGAAGLAAAHVLQARGVAYAMFERQPHPGGRLATSASELGANIVVPDPDRLRLRATVVGLFSDNGRPFLAVVGQARLHLIYFQAALLANGGTPALPAFENNDLPGIYAGRAVSRLIRLHRVLPGERVAVVGEAQEATALAALLEANGATAVAVGATPLRAHGTSRVSALSVRSEAGETRVECDAVAICGPQSPAIELAREGGAAVRWDPTLELFTVEADPQGRTASRNLFVAGELRGPMTAEQAARQGETAALAIAELYGSRATAGGLR